MRGLSATALIQGISPTLFGSWDLTCHCSTSRFVAEAPLKEEGSNILSGVVKDCSNRHHKIVCYIDRDIQECQEQDGRYGVSCEPGFRFAELAEYVERLLKSSESIRDVYEAVGE